MERIQTEAEEGLVVSIPYKTRDLSARVVLSRTSSNEWVLFLNGAGVGLSKDRFIPFHVAFEKAGINSLSFDYIGTGQTGGAMSESSLHDRIRQVTTVLAWLRDTYGEPQKVGLYGVSMGCYVALGVSHLFPELVKKVMLVAGAAYARRAHEVQFGPEFTAILRSDMEGQPSWVDSYSFDWLKESSADMLLVVAEKDEIVPRAISERYRDISLARSEGATEYYIIPGATHYIGRNGEEMALASRLVNFYNT